MTDKSIPADQGLVGAYGEKPLGYFQAARHDIVDDLPPCYDQAILEIGCGTGATLALAKARNKARLTAGIEIDFSAAAVARNQIDAVAEGNVETMTIPFSLSSFDVLIMSEVLEHLVDPWATLRNLRRFLKVGGLLYASSPNISHISVLRQLCRNRFDYADFGITDWTHLRWFTPATYTEMIERSGFRIQWVRPICPMTVRQRVANFLSLGMFSHVFMAQIFVKAERIE